MGPIRIVSEEDAKLAKEIEARLLGTEFDGILFVSVTPAALAYATLYSTVIGCSRKYDERTVCHLVENWLREWYPQTRVTVVCRAGIIREVGKV